MLKETHMMQCSHRFRWRAGITSCLGAFALACGTAAHGQVAATADVADAQPSADAQPVFVDGEAQIVEAFADQKTWIRHDLWVETEFDSDKNDKLDRVHVAVTRPPQTENGLKLPVVYETSPYYAGTASNSKEFFWNTEHEVGAEPPERTPFPPINLRTNRPIISRSQVRDWPTQVPA